MLIVLLLLSLALVIMTIVQEKRECYTANDRKCAVLKPVDGAAPPGGSEQNDYVDQAFANAWERYWCCDSDVVERPDASKVIRNDNGREKVGCANYGIALQVPCFNWTELDPYLREYADRIDNGTITFPNGQTATQYWFESWRWTSAQQWIDAFKAIDVYGPTNKFGKTWTTNGKCGPDNGNTSCSGDQCCSRDGTCGSGGNYCDVSFLTSTDQWVGMWNGEFDGWGNQAY